jgi:predicted RNA binding protein YcfA (HicA-like mRNA interferase family)
LDVRDLFRSPCHFPSPRAQFTRRDGRTISELRSIYRLTLVRAIAPIRFPANENYHSKRRGESDANIRFDDICQLLQAKGFRMRVSGSHHIFTKSGVMERINLQREGSKAKPYQIRQVRKILAQYKLL